MSMRRWWYGVLFWIGKIHRKGCLSCTHYQQRTSKPARLAGLSPACWLLATDFRYWNLWQKRITVRQTAETERSTSYYVVHTIATTTWCLDCNLSVYVRTTNPRSPLQSSNITSDYTHTNCRQIQLSSCGHLSVAYNSEHSCVKVELPGSKIHNSFPSCEGRCNTGQLWRLYDVSIIFT